MKKTMNILISLLVVCLVLALTLNILFITGVIHGAVGPAGQPGAAGSNGADGKDGKDGKSAFEIYCEYHPEYEGTEEEWLESLKGTDGNGGTTPQWFSGNSLDEAEGAVDGDFFWLVYKDSQFVTGSAIYRMADGKWVLFADMTTKKSSSEIAPSPEEGYRIGTVEELKSFRDSVNSGKTYLGNTITLTADLDLSNENWEPIGTNATRFFGVFDGGNKTISNLNIDRPSTDYVGLFGFLGGDKGEIKNLTINHATIKGNKICGTVLGSAHNFGKVNNVTVLDSEIYGLKNIGGIAGEGYVSIQNCKVDGFTAVATPANNDDGDKVGGIIGYQRDSNYTLSGCTVLNAKLTAYRDLGSLVGCYDGVSVADKVLGNKVDGVTLTIDRTIPAGNNAENVRAVIGRIVADGLDADEVNTNLRSTNEIGSVNIEHKNAAN